VYHHGRDAARAFIAAARAEFDGAAVLNLPGDGVEMEEIVAAIRAVIPDAAIEVDEVALPFPPLVDASDFARVVGDVERLSLSEGVAETIERFRTLRAAGAEITPAR
jgi:nucleoside-diphosphate-sugar epimerase